MSLLLLRMTQCCAQGNSDEALQALQSAMQFVQRVSKVAPSLDARLIIGPVIAMTLQDVSAEMSSKALLALIPESAHVSESEQKSRARQPLKRALFLEQPQADMDGQSSISGFKEAWHEQASNQISRYVSASNATQLASLIRSLPLTQSFIRFQGPCDASELHHLPPLSHSSVFLLYLMKALPAPCRTSDASQIHAFTTSLAPSNQSGQDQLGPDSHPNSSVLADSTGAGSQQTAQEQLRSTSAREGSEVSLEEAYETCKKHIKQLEPGQLAALLRFWLLQGPVPIPGIHSSRPELHSALRLRVLQDGIAASMHHVDKIPGTNKQPSEVGL